MTTKRQWSLRPFAPESDTAGVARLWTAVAGFDGSVPALTPSEIGARLQHPAAMHGVPWRVAVANNGAVVGAILVERRDAHRVSAACAVNPAWRRQGIGRALLHELPRGDAVSMTTRASVSGASELLSQHGYAERRRDVRLRRKAVGLTPMPIPSRAAGVEVVADDARDPTRCLAALRAAFDDVDEDEAQIAVRLHRPGARVLYLVSRAGGDARDEGVCLLVASTHARRIERNAAGEPMVGTLERVGLAKAARGRGMSRPLVRAGLIALAAAGYTELEAFADKRDGHKKSAALDLYRDEGFTPIDEDLHWLRPALP
jgi:ribosomal protein S18 acetylase RimI-like enzyme